jgi:uncharacterized protein YegP (UPF0339 family)
MENASIDARYQRKISMNSQYYFNLTASNGFVIGTSEMYESAAGTNNSIESAKNNAPGAGIEDLS